MNKVWPWLLIAVGGIVLPISFAGFDQWYLTWIAFVPLFLAIEGASRRQAAWRGFWFGLIANLIGYYWIPYTIHVFGGFPHLLAWAFDLVLCAYQGLQYSLLAYFINRLQERRYPLALVAPASMVALETVYPLLFPIFMANTQHPVPLLIQASDLLGPLLITAIILLFNVSAFVALRALLRREALPWRQVMLGPLALGALVLYGLVRLPQVEARIDEATPLNVGVVQANMGIIEKWRDVEEGLRRHEQGSMELEQRGADLIVWSEAGYTASYVHAQERNLRHLMAPQLRTPLLVGALRVEGPDGRGERHNSAILRNERGDVLGAYDKKYLLAFGEYIPFGDVFPELYEYSPHTGRLTPGSGLTALPFPFQGRQWSLGVLICYEDILPRFTRDLVRRNSPHLLINMTNDAWFGDTNEPWIHLALAKFRAVEHRRFLVRATNTGVSAIVDPLGRVVQHSPVFRQDVLLGRVRLLEGGTTLYALVGDILGYLALGFLFLGAVQTRRVWLISPRDDARTGVHQAATVLLVVGVALALALMLLLLLQPGGWTPAWYALIGWLLAIAGHVGAFRPLRKARKIGLIRAWTATTAWVLTVLLLLASVSPQRFSTTAVLLGTPGAFSVLASMNLWLWRKKCDT